MSSSDTPSNAFDVVRIGKVIAHFRELSGLSAAEIAERAGIARSYLYKVERGTAENPGLKTLDAIARAMSVTLFDLLTAAGHDPSARGAEMQNEVAEIERLLAEAPKELRDLIAELDAAGGPTDLDTVRTLATLRLRGKRPRTLEDWRYVYQTLVRALR